MIDTDREVDDPRSAPEGPAGLRARLVVGLLGPDDRRAPPFSPYFPRFDLRPPGAALPKLAVPAAALVLACVVIVPPTVALHALSDHARSEISRLQGEATRRKQEGDRYKLLARRLQQLTQEKAALDEVASPGARWTQLVDEIRSQLPPGVRLTELEAASSGSVILKGEALDLRSLGSFMLFLRASGDFVHPLLEDTQRIAGAHPERYSYELAVGRTSTASIFLDAAAPSVPGSSGAAKPLLDGAARSLAPVTPAATGLEANKRQLEEAQKALLDN